MTTDTLSKNYVLASQDKAIYLTDWVDCLLNHMAAITGCDGIAEALVTDLSRINDFPMEPNDLIGLSLALGFSVSESDYLVDVAQKLMSAKPH